jgi:hypothetical protein
MLKKTIKQKNKNIMNPSSPNLKQLRLKNNKEQQL